MELQSFGTGQFLENLYRIEVLNAEKKMWDKRIEPWQSGLQIERST